MAMTLIVDADEVRDAVGNIGEIALPDILTTDDTVVDRVIRRKQALVYQKRGITEAPSDDVDRELVEGLIVDLAANELARRLRPDDAELRETLRREQKEISKDLELAQDSSSETGFGAALL